MRVMILAIAFLALSASPSARTTQVADHLPLARRADLGAVIRPPSATAPATVARISETSALYAAGLRSGDNILAVDGHSLADEIEFDRRIAALRGDREVHLRVRRDNKHLDVRALLRPLAFERIEGVEIDYTHIANPRGVRQRAIISRPAGTTTPRPAILFVPWLSCDTIESPGNPSAGINELLHRVAQSGWVLLRVDKPGVGDSEGVCADTDLDTEIAGSRAALTWLRAHPWVDASKVVIMGHSFSGAFLPVVAESTPIAGYIFINSWVRTWMERLLEFERLQAEGAGMSPAEVSERQRKLTEFYVSFLEEQKTPAQVIRERPELAAVWHDAPGHQYGRSARFHHQLQRINPARAWSAVSVPTLVMWSDADLVMHRIDHERLVAMVNRTRPGAAQLVIVPGADHSLAARSRDGKAELPRVATTAVQQFLERVHAGAGRSQ
jgi:dienelactone hydrolase